MKNGNIQTYILIPASPISFTNKFPQESCDGIHHEHLLPPALCTNNTHSSPPRKFLLTVLRISVHMLLAVIFPILPRTVSPFTTPQHWTDRLSSILRLYYIKFHKYVFPARLLSSLKAWAMFSVPSTVHDIKGTQDAW